jgi:hypothetical protein
MSTAFAQLPPPEVPVPAAHRPSGSGGSSSWATNVGWMLIGAGTLVAIAVLVGLTVLAVHRHRPTGRLRSA